MLRAFKYRLYPNQSQIKRLEEHFGHTRFVYNHCLAKRIHAYQTNKESISKYELIKSLTQLKKREDFKWLKDVCSQALQQKVIDLDKAYQSFFKSKKGFPKFKNKYDKQSFRSPHGNQISIEGSRISLPKFREGIKFDNHRLIKGVIKQATISKSKTGKYYISILCETAIEPKVKTGKSVGIDLGIKTYTTLSVGEKVDKRDLSKIDYRIKRQQRHLSRKVKGSNRYNKCKNKLARLHEKKANSRRDHLHKLSTQLISDYDFISIETLNVSGMMKNRKLSRAIQESSWSEFVTMLEYKARFYGKTIVKIDRWFPSTKTCSSCGSKNNLLSLSDREWTCTDCGTIHDRDVNAAINILHESKKSAGVVDLNKHGENVRLSNFNKFERSLVEVLCS